MCTCVFCTYVSVFMYFTACVQLNKHMSACICVIDAICLLFVCVQFGGFFLLFF